MAKIPTYQSTAAPRAPALPQATVTLPFNTSSVRSAGPGIRRVASDTSALAQTTRGVGDKIRGLKGDVAQVGQQILAAGAAEAESMLAVASFGEKIKGIGDKLAQQRIDEEVVAADTNAKLRLDELRRQIAKEPGMQAISAENFNERARQIQDDVTARVSPAAARQFNKGFVVDSARTQIQVRSDAIVRAKDEALATGMSNLDTLRQVGREQVNDPRAAGETRAKAGAIINGLARNNIINETDAFKMQLKFRDDFNTDLSTAWVDQAARGSRAGMLDVAEKVAGTRPIDNPAVAIALSELPTAVRARLERRAFSQLRQAQADADRTERANEKAAEKATKREGAAVVGTLIESLINPDPGKAPLTYEELRRKHDLGNIDSTSFVLAVRLLNRMGEGVTDPETQRSLRDDIHTGGGLPLGQRKEFYDEVIKRIGEAAASGMLEDQHANSLYTQAKAAQEKDLAASPAYMFEDRLRSVLGKNKSGEWSMPGITIDTQYILRAEAAIAEYQDRVADGENPQQVYLNVVERSVHGSKRTPDGFLSPRVAPTMNVKTATVEQIDAAIEVTKQWHAAKKIDGKTLDRELNNLTGLRNAVSIGETLAKKAAVVDPNDLMKKK